jgi:acetylornithine deacetylase/succinyl-diaminopimelate desuccinylase-like protein
VQQLLKYFASQKCRFIEELEQFLSIESISTRPEFKKQMGTAAKWVAGQLERCGLEAVTVHETSYKNKRETVAGNPVITARTPHVPGAPTVLVYGHYDVQPAEPLDLWKTPPFSPTVKGSKIFARGAADDKGQLFIYFKVLEAFSEVQGGVPLNVKLLIEGEEEVGSPSLVPFIKAHKKELACDAVLVSDTHMHGIKTPSITTGLRGLTCFEISVRTAKGDLHSGTYGGTIANPISVLAELLVGCKDPKSGKIKVPGFYEQVRKLNARQKKSLAATPHDDVAYAKSVGAPCVFGERGFSTLERAGARPTFEINGIYGGYTGEGIKTVLPCEAHAKVSMRLVADQKPTEISKKVQQYLSEIAPPHAKVTVKKLDNNGDAVMVGPQSHAMSVAAEAVEHVFGAAPIFALEGGSIPIVADFQRVLKAEPILLGFGLPDDNLHAPNEKLDLRMFDRGLKTVARFFERYAQPESTAASKSKKGRAH